MVLESTLVEVFILKGLRVRKNRTNPGFHAKFDSKKVSLQRWKKQHLFARFTQSWTAMSCSRSSMIDPYRLAPGVGQIRAYLIGDLGKLAEVDERPSVLESNR